MKTKEYIRPIPATWWLHNRHVLLFMIRELTSLFVAGYAIFLLILLYRFRSGAEAFHQFYEGLRTPGSAMLHIVALVFVVYHSITSFNAAPQIMVVRRGEDAVSPFVIAGANYLMWLILSGLVLLAVFWYPQAQ
jgi:fumarate reductase subunit C